MTMKYILLFIFFPFYTFGQSPSGNIIVKGNASDLSVIIPNIATGGLAPTILALKVYSSDQAKLYTWYAGSPSGDSLSTYINKHYMIIPSGASGLGYWGPPKFYIDATMVTNLVWHLKNYYQAKGEYSTIQQLNSEQTARINNDAILGNKISVDSVANALAVLTESNARVISVAKKADSVRLNTVLLPQKIAYADTSSKIETRGHASLTYQPKGPYLTSYTETDPTISSYAKSLTAFSVIKTSTDPLYKSVNYTPSSSEITSSLGYTPYNGTTNPNSYISSVPVSSVFGRTGAITAYAGDYSAYYYPLTGNPSGFITSVTGAQVNTALGYTAYNGSTNPNGYISTVTSSQLTAALGFTPISPTTASSTYELLSNKTATQSTSVSTYPNWAGVTSYAYPNSNPSGYLSSSSAASSYEPKVTGGTLSQFYDGTKTFRALAVGDIPLALMYNTLNKSANYTILSTDFISGNLKVLDLYVDATGGNVTITLPLTPIGGSIVYVTKTDATANTVTVNGLTGNNTLLSQYQGRTINNNGTLYFNH